MGWGRWVRGGAVAERRRERGLFFYFNCNLNVKKLLQENLSQVLLTPAADISYRLSMERIGVAESGKFRH
jgi:hypothetical protein